MSHGWKGTSPSSSSRSGSGITRQSRRARLLQSRGRGTAACSRGPKRTSECSARTTASTVTAASRRRSRAEARGPPPGQGLVFGSYQDESPSGQRGNASGSTSREIRLRDPELLLEARVLALHPHARALVKALRARPIPGIDDERDVWAAPAVELDERLVEERETQPPPTPAAGDGELANPALALVVRADDAPRQLVPGEGEEPEGGVERPALDVVSLPLLEGLERPTALVVREGARDHPVHGFGIALRVKRAHRDSLRPLGFRRRLVER